MKSQVSGVMRSETSNDRMKEDGRNAEKLNDSYVENQKLVVILVGNMGNGPTLEIELSKYPKTGGRKKRMKLSNVTHLS